MKNHWFATKYIGMQFVEIIVNEGNLNEGDSLLIAGDGFYNAKKNSGKEKN